MHARRGSASNDWTPKTALRPPIARQNTPFVLNCTQRCTPFPLGQICFHSVRGMEALVLLLLQNPVNVADRLPAVEGRAVKGQNHGFKRKHAAPMPEALALFRREPVALFLRIAAHVLRVPLAGVAVLRLDVLTV